MPFEFEANQEIIVGNVSYYIAEHPVARGIAYGQAGRQAIVYQLVAPDGAKHALKVFKPRYRLPALVGLTDKLVPFAPLPGLSVCHRTVLIPQRHADLLRQYPDLTYAVRMPWIEGPTWTEVLLHKRTLLPGESLLLAHSLAEVLATMEQSGLAHCDLSGPNVLLPALASTKPELQRDDGVERHLESPVSLVDVEQLYAPGMAPSQFLPSGSPGYSHKTATEGSWAPEADRFAGALLIAEMLGWCDERVRESAHGESYFDPDELQQDGRRYTVLRAVLEQAWGANVARLFEQAWHSDILADCATFGEWLVMLPDEAPGTYEMTPIADEPSPLSPPPPLPIEKTEGQALALEQTERWEEAAEVYRRLLASSTDHPNRSWWQTGLARCQEETLLVRLFDDGIAAYRQGDFRATKELLEEVVRRRPGYDRNGLSAMEILGRLRESKEPRDRNRILTMTAATLTILLGLLIMSLLGALTGKGPMGSLFWTDTPTPTTTFTPTSTWTPTLTNTPTSTDTPSPTSTSTWTPTPSWTPTSTETPTDTPTPTPSPRNTPTPRTLDDFEGYGGDGALQAAYTINAAGGRNGARLSLERDPARLDSSRNSRQGTAFHYDIRHGAPNDYCGFERRFGQPQNWQRYRTLHFWAMSDGSGRHLVVQFMESSGEVWKHYIQLSEFGTQEFNLGLNQQGFEDRTVFPELADPQAERYRNGRIDLQAITYYAFYVGLGDGNPGTGTIYIDSVELR